MDVLCHLVFLGRVKLSGWVVASNMKRVKSCGFDALEEVAMITCEDPHSIDFVPQNDSRSLSIQLDALLVARHDNNELVQDIEYWTVNATPTELTSVLLESGL